MCRDRKDSQNQTRYSASAAGLRFVDADDTARFVSAAKRFVTANTVSSDAANKVLRRISENSNGQNPKKK